MLYNRDRKPAVPDQAGQYQAKGARQASSRWPSVSSARQVDDAHCAGFERRHTCRSVPTGHTSTYTLSQEKNVPTREGSLQSQHRRQKAPP